MTTASPHRTARPCPRRYLVALAAGFLVPLLGWVACYQAQLGAPTETSRFVHECLCQKVELARRIEGRRLLVVSGSSGFYGISAGHLGRALGIDAVNLGVHAGLELRYLVDQAKDLARPGDVILLSLEYEHYWDDPDLNNVLLDYLVSRDNAYYETLPLAARVRAAFGISLDRLYQGVAATLSAPAKRADDRYTCLADAHGDETRNVPPRQRPSDRVKLSRISARVYGDKIGREAWAWGILGELAEWSRAHDVTVVAAFPNMVDFPSQHEGSDAAFFQSIADGYAAVGIPTLGTPWESMYPLRDFFDSRYHLFQAARDRHTARLAGLLAPHVRVAGR